MTSADDADTGRAPALRAEGEEGPAQSASLAALLAQACRAVLDGQVSAVGAALASAARTLLTAGDDGHPQPVVQMAAAAGTVRNARHIALADLHGWPLYSVESARITLHLAIPAPPGADGVLHLAIPTTAATKTMTATIRLSTRPGPRPLAEDLAAAALVPAPPSVDSDRFSAPARQAVAAWRHLPSLYRCAERLLAETPGHPATTAAVQASEDLAAAVCTWCAGGPPVDPRLVARAPHPENLDLEAPPALVALAATVSELHRSLGTPDRV
ncbi:hypothetical protein C3486_34655 [Streptomyces sp. Ru73]|uniref:hypothetical protein n=1 Tax=Streptomyces sp. Ru73 TaxID=2080748 RepID=UPI000CDD05AC|nr:hypothetical protein [Streptomyces sp. Ru73]POX36232.1 hypothetical protein C3486_34655 [Streptomyces sp. Ru73]